MTTARPARCYPFAFRFEVAYVLDDDALEQTFTIVNTGRDVLPASVGAHPGFAWPLADAVDKQAHVLEFAEPEPAPVRRLDGGLLSQARASLAGAGPHAGLVAGIVRCRRADPGSTGQPFRALRRPRRRSDRGQLGRLHPAWPLVAHDRRRQPAATSCASSRGTAWPVPASFDGEFMDKPGLMLIPPGERRVLTLRIRLC